MLFRSHLSKTIGLHNYVVISRYIEKNNGRDENKQILEDVFEAFIGALYLHSGFDICRSFFVKLMEDKIDICNILQVETNFKDKLLQYFHQQRWIDPLYGTLNVSGPENKKLFTVYVKQRKNHRDTGIVIATGTGTSKKKGEQEAARQALITYGVIKEEDSDDDTYEEVSDFEDGEED